MLTLRAPYLLYLGDVTHKSNAKTAFGLRDWCPERVLGEWSLPGTAVTLGLPRLSPEEAAAQGAGSFVIGIAPVGGGIAPSWVPDIERAIAAGLDIVSGMHARLSDNPTLAAAAARHGVALVDVRHMRPQIPAATGRRRTGKRVATVGTDCALGKKYTALALTRALQSRGAPATFRATGQTGIMIAGEGIAMDAVVSDFLAGAAELLSPDNAPDHWDVIEGQGSLFHPAYAAVTLGLLHGSQPDAIVLCHDASRTTIESYPDYPIPSLRDAIIAYEMLARLTNPAARVVGVSINSSSLGDEEWTRYASRVEGELGLPVCDPMRGGVDRIADAILTG